ncbi:MAG TPA: hypothetical protein VNN22_01795 [Verrucomicrobiae bacterium]|nr:hypothetical protein [Verrucomicrobiae bacterium]
MNARWKIFITVAVFLVLMTCVWLMTIRIQPANEVEAYKKSLREKGEKLELSEVLPPPVPAASNSVNAVEDAFRLIGTSLENLPDAMKMVAPGRAMVGWRQPDARGYDFTNSWDDFAAEVAANNPAIELLHQVLERPRLDFQLDYKKGSAMLLPHLAPMKRAVQLLCADAVLDLHNGDTGAATTNILTMLGLAQKNAGEGPLISHLVRIAMTAFAVMPTWELLQTTNVTDAQLALVQNGWEQLDYLSDIENAFAMERVFGMNFIEQCRATPLKFEDVFGASPTTSGSSSSTSTGWDWETLTEKPRQAIGMVMWRSSWSYSDELRLLKGDTIILETLRTMQTNRSQFYKADYDAMTTRLSSLGITNAGEALFRALKIPDFSDAFGGWSPGNVVQKAIKMETARRVVVTAIALKRFQMKHGNLPEALNELVPEFLQSVPIDPNDGHPLRYHPNADGMYLLYSVGDNGVDDGGDPSLEPGVTGSFLQWQNNHAHDWVWPQPATAAEIQKYYEEQARKAR